MMMNTPNHTRLLDAVLNDKRSKTEILESITSRLMEKSGGTMSESQAIEAAQRLINLFKICTQQSIILPNDIEDLNQIMYNNSKLEVNIATGDHHAL